MLIEKYLLNERKGTQLRKGDSFQTDDGKQKLRILEIEIRDWLTGPGEAYVYYDYAGKKNWSDIKQLKSLFKKDQLGYGA